MLAESTIRRQLQQLRRHLRRAASGSDYAYGAMQALAWALGEDAQSPKACGWCPLGGGARTGLEVKPSSSGG